MRFIDFQEKSVKRVEISDQLFQIIIKQRSYSMK
jgi:hypothetical protein